MTNIDIKALCMKLLQADSEDEVVSILDNIDYWNNHKVWRLIGDREGNYSTIGNQQSRPEAALTEKIINAIDARLMSECFLRGIDPKSHKAPQSIPESVRCFFEGKEVYDDFGGTVQGWDTKHRRIVSEGITVAVTGSKRNPCVTVSDIGEGQTPNMMPETFLSIDRQNKLRIFFVQGKYNMGGTGVLEFCGTNNIQLIITRRNPNIVNRMGENDPSDEYWGFTIVRIQTPSERAKNSVYTYLAPVGAENEICKGSVLRFKSKSLRLLPKGNKPYVRETEWGSAVKMYNYDMKGFASHACMKDGLLYRLGAMIPEPALPVRIYECRDYKGHSGSFATTLSGLKIRLEDNKAENLEEGFPTSAQFKVKQEEMLARIYAFKKGRAETYRTNEGIIFTVNGQTHGAIPKTVFGRKNVKMGTLADSLLILVDCSHISNRAREKLFMNSRDRLRFGELRKALEAKLEDIIHCHPRLRELRERRKNQRIADRLDNSKPLEDVLKNIFKTSPSLSSLFLTGSRLSKPFKQRPAGKQNGAGGGGSGTGNGGFVGKLHPTLFKFKKKEYGEIFHRDSEQGRCCRIDFETDTVNDYFDRATNPGRFILEILDEERQHADIDWSLTLHDGMAHASIDIPDDIIIEEKVTLQFTVEDDTILEPFVNIALLQIKPKSERNGGGGNKPKRNRKGGGDGDQFQPAGIQLPNITRIHEQDWNGEFDQFSACKIDQGENEEDESQDVYDFSVNVDNLYLRTDMKESKEDPRVIEDKFVYANVLLGLGLIRDYREMEKKFESAKGEPSAEDFTVEKYVNRTTRALAPLILPMINNLGALSEDDVEDSGQIGDDE